MRRILDFPRQRRQPFQQLVLDFFFLGFLGLVPKMWCGSNSQEIDNHLVATRPAGPGMRQVALGSRFALVLELFCNLVPCHQNCSVPRRDLVGAGLSLENHLKQQDLVVLVESEPLFPVVLCSCHIHSGGRGRGKGGKVLGKKKDW